MGILSAVGNLAGNIVESMAEQTMSDKFNEVTDTIFRNPRLKDSVQQYLKNKYENECFYNNLTYYLENYKIIDNTIAMFYNANYGVLSKKDFVKKHLNGFVDAFERYRDDLIAMMLIKSSLEELYTIIETAITYISPHTDSGKLLIQAEIHQSELCTQFNHTDKKLDKIIELIQDSNKVSTTSINESVVSDAIANDIKDGSSAIKEFEKRIESISQKTFSYENETVKISKYLALFADLTTQLYNEPRDQIDKLICSLYCRTSICYCNLGNYEEALSSLEKIPEEAKKENKLYHYVFSLIVAVHKITSRFSEAIESANKALQIDNNYHRAFLVRSFLYALVKKVPGTELLRELDEQFKSILELNEDAELINEYHLYRGFICNEYENYNDAINSFVAAKNNGYDELVADCNIGTTYYTWACEKVPRNKVVFCADVDVELLCKTIEILKRWLFSDDYMSIIPYTKSKLVSIYVSACMFLGISHNLSPLQDYISLPYLEYEALRSIILGSDDIISEDAMNLLSADDRLHAKITNYLKECDISNAKNCITDLGEIEFENLPQSIKIMFLQICISDKDIENYEKYRGRLTEKDNGEIIDCMDAYVMALKGNVEEAKHVIDNQAITSMNFKILRNIVAFYAQYGFLSEEEELLLRIFDLHIKNLVYIADIEWFYIEAINFFTRRKSNQVLKFIERIDFEHIDKKAACSAKAIFFSSINDIPNMLVCTSELFQITHKEQYAFNQIDCLIKLFRYDDALACALELFEIIPDSNVDERERIYWLISDIYLFLNDLDNSNEWALKAHDYFKENPYKLSHQSYINRATRAGHTEAISKAIDYKHTHPVVVDWLKEVKILAESTDGTALIKAISEATGYNADEYDKQQWEVLKTYKNQIPSNYFLLKYYNYDLSKFFIFADQNKIVISNGSLAVLQNEKQLVEDHIIIDAITLITMKRYKCFETLNNIKHVHISYATVGVLQSYFLTHDYHYVADILEWLQSADNVVFENDGIWEFDADNSVFTYEFTACCNIAGNHDIPLLTIETIASAICTDPKSYLPQSLRTVSINAFCEKIMGEHSTELNQMIYSLMNGCTFINFTSDTIIHQIIINNYVVEKEMLSPFMTCNTKSDMISFANVYLATIKQLAITNLDAAVEFARIVFENAMKIWRKGDHDRWVCTVSPDSLSEYRVKAINQYLIFLTIQFVGLNLSIPIDLQNTISELQEKIVQHFGKEYFLKLSQFLSHKTR